MPRVHPGLTLLGTSGGDSAPLGYPTSGAGVGGEGGDGAEEMDILPASLWLRVRPPRNVRSQHLPPATGGQSPQVKGRCWLRESESVGGEMGGAPAMKTSP